MAAICLSGTPHICICGTALHPSKDLAVSAWPSTAKHIRVAADVPKLSLRDVSVRTSPLPATAFQPLLVVMFLAEYKGVRTFLPLRSSRLPCLRAASIMTLKLAIVEGFVYQRIRGTVFFAWDFHKAHVAEVFD